VTRNAADRNSYLVEEVIDHKKPEEVRL